MKCLPSYLCVMFCSMCLGGVSGCAKEWTGQFKTPDGNYEQILEKQKAGIEQQDPLGTLPDMTVEEHEKLGDAHMRQGRFGLAVAQYGQVLAKESERTRIRYKMAMLLLQNGQTKEANTHFQKILEQDNQFALAYEGKGQALLIQGDLFGADQAFRKALNVNPKLWRSHNYLGIMADRRHLHLSAIEAYKAALSIQPREGAVLNNLGMAHYMNRHYRQAARTFYQAMQAGIDSPKVANNLGLALSKLGRFPQAFDAFKKSTNQAKAYNNVGIALLEAGQPRRAMLCFKKAIDLEPTYYKKAKDNLDQAKRAASQVGRKSSSQMTPCL